ncbi:hypothetical protein GPJ56_001618 [Histomonas meleagridis]|uniref:uncharacterized protein n=1 Tax=Histomonas meleagridis TaxID=135588 RepID=UPI003559AEC3|nr:hypothetical protein GPJ56_001618 [Histomonas meleagridis]KAH0807124.1 hypothetical protein GO595_000300 [Histomonas meleagridis]
MSKGKFIPMPKLIEQCSLENNGFNSYEIQEQKLLLISLMLLSEGSEHFHDNISLFKSIYRFVCMPPKSDEKLNNFFRMAKISLITSCGRFIEHKDIKFNFKSENYVTLQYIISVIGHNQIAIRHGLGYNIFEVENLTKNEFKIEDDQQFGTYERIEPYNIYKSQCDFDDPNDEKNLQEVDSLFNCEEDFYELEETTTESTLNSAHSFLCDLGFLSKDSISHTRKIYESNFMVKKIESIDRKVSTPLKVPILQIVHKNEDFVAKETKLAKELLKNIENVGNSRIFHFKYLTYKNSEKNQIEKESKRLGYVIILNEMNMEINSKASINDQYKVILCLTPINGFYVVNFIYKENSVFKEKGQMKFIVYKEYIGQIITLVSLLIHSAEPDEFIMCFERRTKIIKEVFDAAKMEEPDFRTFFFGAYEDAFGDK